MTTSNDAKVFLDNLTPAARTAVAKHILAEAASALTADLPTQPNGPATVASKPKAKAKAKASGKRVINRQKTADGRSASQYIRDLDAAEPGLLGPEVVKRGAADGLVFNVALVYNVRKNERKAAKTDTSEQEAADKAAKRKEVLQGNAAKARAAKAAKKEAAAKAEAEKAEKRAAAAKKAAATRAAKKAEAAE